MRTLHLSVAITLSSFVLINTGCKDTVATRDDALQSGYAALEQKQFDRAVVAADKCLGNPNDTSADAMHLKGRGIYGRHKADLAQEKADLQEARECYEKALAMNPSSNLEPVIRCDLANVAYFQEDYAAADSEWAACVDKLTPDAKSWTLYRMGLCRQRLARWAEADELFATVQQNYPNTVPAQRARDHQGMKGFYVQVGTYRDVPAADGVVAKLKSQGLSAIKTPRPSSNAQAVLVGPAANYTSAQALKQQLAGTYTDAIVIP